MEDKQAHLFARAEAILARRANGFGIPILKHLALRKYGPALLSLAARDTADGERAELGRIGDRSSPSGMMYQAYRQGAINAAQNLALTYFYVGDLGRYRFWLQRAARRGDCDAHAELRRFEQRQPYPLARKLGRLRPLRRSEV